ncbi:hypothetical protein Syun_000550 [Stephania yunnanensis]|uniref:Uncharacterized protein n=1 Tax=Stephania yunnanensis TaxID=152371 RepID=A0AAP0LD84_9MAGN
MVLQKRLEYGFNGYQMPSMPRASRSARRSSMRKNVENNQLCAFELLATVAGKLLQERESSSSSNVSMRTPPGIGKDVSKQEIKGVVKNVNPVKVEQFDQVHCDDNASTSSLSLQAHHKDLALSAPHGLDESIITNPYRSEKFGCHDDTVSTVSGNTIGKLYDGIDNEGYPGLNKSYEGDVGIVEGKMEPESRGISSTPKRTMSDPCISGNFVNMGNSSLKVLLCRDPLPHGSFSQSCDRMKGTSQDGDDNSFGCNQTRTMNSKTLRTLPRIGDRRIRKLFASKYWRVAPNLKERELSNDGDMKPFFSHKRPFYTRERSHRNFTLKRRRTFEPSLAATSYRRIDSELSGPRIKGNAFGPKLTKHGGNVALSSVSGPDSSFNSKDSQVKLSIKSFKIPELFIEIPENATVGSLKRTVKEAVTAILEGGLCVGVLIQGKKVKDDAKTLLQTGICKDNKLDGLGFELEPNSTNLSPLCSETLPFLLPCDSSRAQSRYSAMSALNPGTSDSSLNPPEMITNTETSSETNLALVPIPSDMSVDKLVPNSRALVDVPSSNAEPLAVVSLHSKSKRAELVQRRTRRPFSVSEVEALVQAVEKLGTGRWRDVKIRSFDAAKHRTYVDLKDKWKTLVHTARISPQQRRGEPVPQELLDRVLSAHAYWSHQQTKQQLSLQTDSLGI